MMSAVRSVMAELESRGFVQTPHISAGRVPTARAYRFFIDTLVTMQSLHDAELQDIRFQLEEEPIDTRWIGETPPGHALSERHGRVC
jgi:transcriptional regulator of heat shock response